MAAMQVVNELVQMKKKSQGAPCRRLNVEISQIHLRLTAAQCLRETAEGVHQGEVLLAIERVSRISCTF